MTSVLERIQKEVTDSTTFQQSVLKEVGWDDMTDEQKLEAQAQAKELIIHKATTVIKGIERMKARTIAMHNTATQFRRKVEKMYGEINSLENTARNIENKVDEDTLRLNQIIKAALILQITENKVS